MTVTNSFASVSRRPVPGPAASSSRPNPGRSSVDEDARGSLGTATIACPRSSSTNHLDAVAEVPARWTPRRPPPSTVRNRRRSTGPLRIHPAHFARIVGRTTCTRSEPRSQFSRTAIRSRDRASPMIWDPLTSCSAPRPRRRRLRCPGKRALRRPEKPTVGRAVESRPHSPPRPDPSTRAPPSTSAKPAHVAPPVSRCEDARIGNRRRGCHRTARLLLRQRAITYEALGIAGEGEGTSSIDPTTPPTAAAGRHPVRRPFISKCHPSALPASPSDAEPHWHLSYAGERQFEGARIGLQQNIGLGSAGPVAVYKVWADPMCRPAHRPARRHPTCCAPRSRPSWGRPLRGFSTKHWYVPLLGEQRPRH